MSTDVPSPLSRFSRFDRSRWFYAILIAYFAMHLAIRLCISSTVNHDESEQILFSQSLRWGYSEQPPLITWMTRASFRVFGLSIAAFTLQRWLVLAATYVFVYLITRSVLRDNVKACLASLSLWLSICFTWQFLRDQTHTPLACALSAATFYVVLQLAKRRTLMRYVWLGLIVGLGMLAKYNFIIVIVGTMLAVASLKPTRGILLDWRLLIGIGVAVAVVLPHFLWMLDHLGPIREFTQSKIGNDASQGTLLDWLAAMQSLALNLLLVLGLLAAGYCMLFRKELFAKRDEPIANPQLQLLYRTLAFMLLLLVLLPLATHQRRYANHWITPYAVLVPTAIFARLPKFNLAPIRYRMVMATLALTVLGYAIGHVSLAAKYRGRDELFTSQVLKMEERLRSTKTVITDDHVTAANLRLRYPHAKYVSLRLGPFHAEDERNLRGLIVWNASWQDVPSPAFTEYLRKYHGIAPAPGATHEWVRVEKERPWAIHSLGFADAAADGRRAQR